MNVIPLIPHSVQQGRFGLCPRCCSAEGPISLHGQQWLYCGSHRLKWFIGERQIGGWQDQFNAYRIFPDVDAAERLKALWDVSPFYPGEPHGPGEAA